MKISQNAGFPDLSIIICSKNDLLGLKRTLNSLLIESSLCIELILVVADYSDDEISELSRTYNLFDQKIFRPKKEGLYEAMNFGLKRAIGEFVFFLNGGDELADMHALEELALSLHGRSWGYGALLTVDDSTGKKKIYKFKPYILNFHRLGIKFVPHPSTLVRREEILKFGGFEPEIKIASDQDLLLKFAKAEKPFVSKSVISIFYLGGTSTRSAEEIVTDFKKLSFKNFGYILNSKKIDSYVWRILLIARLILS